MMKTGRSVRLNNGFSSSNALEGSNDGQEIGTSNYLCICLTSYDHRVRGAH